MLCTDNRYPVILKNKENQFSLEELITIPRYIYYSPQYLSKCIANKKYYEIVIDIKIKNGMSFNEIIYVVKYWVF